MEACFKLKIIPEFDGTCSVVEWVKKVELMCDLLGVKWFDHVVFLQLTAGSVHCVRATVCGGTRYGPN